MDSLTEKKSLLRSFELLFAASNRGDLRARRLAMDMLLAKGLPGPKTEEYRYTPVVRVLEKNFNGVIAPAPTSGAKVLQPIPEMTSNIIAFINGKFSAVHSRLLDSSITISTTAPGNPNAGDDPFALLNHAFCDDIIRISVAPHQHVAHPVMIVYYVDTTTYVFGNPRWVLHVGAQSKVSVAEFAMVQYQEPFFANRHSNIILEEQAELEFTAIQSGSDSEVLVNNTTIDLGTSSRAVCNTVTLNGMLIRNNLTINLNGEKVDARLNGLYLASGNTLIDNHTVVDHRKPNSYSNELYKGILEDQGKAVFNGKIFVRPDAQKTNAFQSNRNILLSEQATIHTKPQLEIWADDVKCSHGCTTGQLDEEALFYLRSRGLSHDIARGMLLGAFASETLQGISNEPVRQYLENLIARKLHTPTTA